MRGWRDVAELKKGKRTASFFFLFCLFMLGFFCFFFLSVRGGVLPEAFQDSIRQPLQCIYCCSAASVGS